MQVLPQRTQRNILSTNGLFKRKMYSYVKLFRYLLPLLVMKTSFYVSWTVYVRVIKCRPLKCNTVEQKLINRQEALGVKLKPKTAFLENLQCLSKTSGKQIVIDVISLLDSL